LPYINVQKITLPGEFFAFCYTDGLTDIQNPSMEYIDVNHLSDFLEGHHQFTPSQFNKAMVDYIVAYKAGRKIGDDISLLTCKVYGESGRR